MSNDIHVVQKYYDSDVLSEWLRLEKHPFEFIITTYMMEKYIKPGDRILDIGGGPGRYSLYFASKGCDVTLVDLSTENIQFAKEKSRELGVNLKAIAGDAREVNKLVKGTYDHVFNMGPMYHLLKEEDRVKAIESALSLLKEGGHIYVSFILMFSGMIYCMKYNPEAVLLKEEEKFIESVIKNDSFAGEAFTSAFFIKQGDIIPFMSQFPLEKVHLFGQESILAPCEVNLLNQPKDVLEKWLEIGKRLCEREDFISYSEHVMYVGKRKEDNSKVGML